MHVIHKFLSYYFFSGNEDKFFDFLTTYFTYMIDKELTLIVRHGCIYCEMAINLLDEKELSYKLLVLDEDFSREEFYEMVPNAKTFPQILVNGKTIGGYEELAVKINNLS